MDIYDLEIVGEAKHKKYAKLVSYLKEGKPISAEIRGFLLEHFERLLTRKKPTCMSSIM